MLTLVTGGAGSGKSAFAERELLRLAGEAPRVYLATMAPFGEEAKARIARHKNARAGKGFLTIERERELAALEIPFGAAVLLEDLGNLCANELFTPGGTRERAEAAVLAGIESLLRRCGQLVVVTNEIFSGGTAPGEETDLYFRLLAACDRRLAARAERVAEVVCGVPVFFKEG